MIIAMKSVNTLHAFHMQSTDAVPLGNYINDEAESNNPNMQTEPEIRAMQRPRQRKNGNEHNELKAATLIQRKGQETNDIEWITAWTPCFDIEHPGPDLQDESTQWYESPFAIETTDWREHTSIVRGIRQHELAAMLGYDENSHYRILQQPP
jgi:hypothetical protein